MLLSRRLPHVASAVLVFVFASLVVAAPATQPGAVAVPAAQQKAPKKGLSQYLRYVDQGVGGARLETADVVFVNDQGVVVRLVSAVHIGEATYFKSLADSFRERDAVLYELVKPRDAELPKPGGEPAHHAVAQLQQFLKDTLNLEYQLDQIDYSQPNFIHADLDAETFERMQAERGESFATLMLQQLMRAMAQPPKVSEEVPDFDQTMQELVKMITRPDMERQIKKYIARQLGEMEEHALGLDGPNGSVILTERNKAAIKVLENVLEDGKRDIAIFYGAAHMPDLAERLQALGFKPVATEWRMAWDLTIRADEPSAVEKLLMEMLRGLDEPPPR